MRKPPSRHGPKAEMNVVPYIDVMLVLLVIFMVTAPMLTQGVKVELPKARGQVLATAPEQLVVTVSVTADGAYYWQQSDAPARASSPPDMAPVSLADMVSRISAIVSEHPKAQVYIRADQQVAYGHVLKGMAALQEQGVSQMGLLTDMPQEKGRG